MFALIEVWSCNHHDWIRCNKDIEILKRQVDGEWVTNAVGGFTNGRFVIKNIGNF